MRKGNLTEKELERLIIQARRQYYSGNGFDVISDEEYDSYENQLRNFNPNHYLLSAVGFKPQNRERLLPHPMFSMKKILNKSELMSWLSGVLSELNLNSVDVIITGKYDGISICAMEDRGLVWTRGDGVYGQSIDLHYNHIHESGVEIAWNYGNVVTYGEAIIPKSDFERYLRTQGYKSSRNSVTGLLSPDEPRPDKLKYIHYIRYGSNYEGFDTKEDMMSELNMANSIEVKYEVFRLAIDNVDAFIEYINHKYQIWSNNIPMDGIVIEINNLEYQKSLGRYADGNPIYAVAYKGMEFDSGRTRVKRVRRQVSKSGRLVPVCDIEPIELESATVTKVTGVNEKFLREHGIVAGTIIEVKRSGGVIPKIVRSISDTVSADSYPSYIECPSCQSISYYNGQDFVCGNPQCKDKVISQILHFFNTIDVSGVKEGIINRFWNSGYKSIKSILSAAYFNKYDDIDISPKVIAKIYKSILEKTSNISEYKLMAASPYFEGLSESTIQIIADGREKINGKRISKNKLEAYKIGLNGYNQFKRDINPYINAVVYNSPDSPKCEGTIIDDALSYYTIVMSGFRDKELKDVIISHSGRVVDTLSKKVSHLVIPDGFSKETSKIKKARANGIAIVEVTKFKEIINNSINDGVSAQ